MQARTAVDLPVPRRPQISTPPIDGLMAFSIKASRRFSWPTIALNGNGTILVAPFTVWDYLVK
jgi:hypothetical protein